MTPPGHAADLAAVHEAIGCTPNLAMLRLLQLRHERTVEAFHRRAPAEPVAVLHGQFIDLTSDASLETHRAALALR